MPPFDMVYLIVMKEIDMRWTERDVAYPRALAMPVAHKSARDEPADGKVNRRGLSAEPRARHPVEIQ